MMEESSRPTCHYLCLNHTNNHHYPPQQQPPTNNHPTKTQSADQHSSNNNNSNQPNHHSSTNHQNNTHHTTNHPFTSNTLIKDDNGVTNAQELDDDTDRQTDEQTETSHRHDSHVVSVCLSHEVDDAPDWSFDEEDDAILNFQPT